MSWTMPPWLAQYEHLVLETGDRTVEEVMNGPVRCVANLLDYDPVGGRGMLVNIQVGLLTELHARGLLKDVPPCPLKEKA